jgi:hypothetical protein
MATDPRKSQKKREKHAAKRKHKQQQLVKEKHAGFPERMAEASRFPILASWASEALWQEGLGNVCLSRSMPNGAVAFAVFLLDRYCLGVKNAFAAISSRFEYESKIQKLTSQFGSRELPPATVRKFVEDAAAYAEELGFHPHADYRKSRLIFGDIDTSGCKETLEFGKDGKPFFFAGPHDGPSRCQAILKTLEEHCGPDGYHYWMPISGDSAELLQGSFGRPAPGGFIEGDPTEALEYGDDEEE